MAGLLGPPVAWPEVLVLTAVLVLVCGRRWACSPGAELLKNAEG